jgi:cytochrome c-type biogenesis protein CcmH
MEYFWAIAAAMIALALVFVLLPLLRSKRAPERGQTDAELTVLRARLRELHDDLARGALNEQNYEAARQELEHAVLNIRKYAPARVARGGRELVAGLGVLLILPALAIYGYRELGARDEVLHAAAQEAEQEQQAAKLRSGIARLEEHLGKNPEDGKSWHMLGRALLLTKEFSRARLALEQAEKFQADNADLLLDKLQVVAALKTSDDTSEQVRLVDRALSLEPQSPRALWMGSLVALETGDTSKAKDRLQRLLTLLPANDPNIALIKQQIAALDNTGPDNPAANSATPVSSARIVVNVRLDPALQNKVKPDDIVFIFARAKDGPKMPLAVERARASDLPKSTVLDDSKSMRPDLSLSRFAEVVVGARISRSGQPTAQSGDLEGYAPQALPVGQAESPDVNIIIDKELP